MRKPGKPKVAEVKGFQERRGITVDGIPGHQTMGEVLAIETENAGLKETVKKLKNAPIDDPDDEEGYRIPGPVWFIVGGLVVYLAGEYLF